CGNKRKSSEAGLPKRSCQWCLLSFGPNLVILHMSGTVVHDINFVDAHFTGNRLDDVRQFPADAGFILAVDRISFNLENEASPAVRSDYYSGLMRNASSRFVLKVDPIGREKHENQDKRYHHVVLDSAALVRPKNVAADCAPHFVHGRAGCIRDGTCLCTVQV